MRSTRLLINVGFGALVLGCSSIGAATRTIKGEREKTEANFAQAAVNGKWQASCGSFFQQPEGNFQTTTTLVIDQGKLTRDVTFWSDAACTIKIMAKHQTSTFVVGDSTSLTMRAVTPDGFVTIDTPATEPQAAALNSAAACTQRNWSAGQPLDVSATPCNSFNSNEGTAINAVQVDSSVPPMLTLYHQVGNTVSAVGQYTAVIP